MEQESNTIFIHQNTLQNTDEYKEIVIGWELQDSI